MNAPVQKGRSSSTTAPCSRKNQMAYMRHVEIETVNRKLLENMSKIMQNDYKSAVKTAISNRKRFFLSSTMLSTMIYPKFQRVFNSCWLSFM